MDRPSNETMHAWRAFLEAHARVTQKLATELESTTGLPLAWYDVLVHLNESPAQRLRMNELANAVLLSKSGLTRLVDRMTDAGLTERQPCEDDARGHYVHLTPAGLAALRRSAPVHLDGIQRYFGSQMDSGQANALAAGLQRVVNRTEAATSRGSREVPSAPTTKR